MGQEERQAVVEGLARVVACLPRATASEAGLRLVHPLVARAQSVAQHGGGGGGGGGGASGGGGGAGGLSRQQLGVLAADLRLMASAVRFMEPPAHMHHGGGHGSTGVALAAAAAEAAGEPHPALKVGAPGDGRWDAGWGASALMWRSRGWRGAGRCCRRRRAGAGAPGVKPRQTPGPKP
jgi:hypothetical protein